MMKIDLHVHTHEYSACGRSGVKEQIEAAIDAGLDAIVFADHDHLFPLERLRKLNEIYAPFRMFSGIELTEATGEHLLILGVHDPALELYRWSYPELYTLVQDHQGFIALNHPFRFLPDIEIDYRQFPLDAIEAYSNNIRRALQPQIFDIAKELGIHVLSNSDGHYTAELGQYYNLLEQTPADERDLIHLLKTGQFTCVAPNKNDKDLS